VATPALFFGGYMSYEERAVKSVVFPYRLLEKMRQYPEVDWDQVYSDAIEAKLRQIEKEGDK